MESQTDGCTPSTDNLDTVDDSVKDTGFTMKDKDNWPVFVRQWEPGSKTRVRAVVILAHGMGEHIGRYDWFASELARQGYIVIGSDFYGHGRTKTSDNKEGYLGPDGFQRMVNQVRMLRNQVATVYPGLPVLLFGHSMGSFVAHRTAELEGDKLDGVILSGSAGKQSPMVHIGIALANLVATKFGEDTSSPLLNKLVFGGYNRRIPKPRTERDWLSRDAAVVDRYLADPMCNFVLTSGSWRDLFRGLILMHRKEEINRIPKDLPFLIISGDQCPLGHYGKGVRQLTRTLRQHGLGDVELKTYASARHELIQEVNRDEVLQDVVRWLEMHSAVQARYSKSPS